MLERFERLHLDILRGGMTIDTPPEQPILRTIIQFDGDIQNIVFCVTADEWAPEETALHTIFAAHQAAVAGRVDAFGGLLNVTAVAGDIALGLSIVGGIHWLLDVWHHTTALRLALDFGVAVLPVSLRLMFPPLFGLALRAATRRIALERTSVNQSAIHHLRYRK